MALLRAPSAEAPPVRRLKPCILVTGTPGTGKTCTSELLAEYTGFKHVNIGDWVKQKAFHAGKDATFDAYILDEDSEDKLIDELDPLVAEGGLVVDFHSNEFFPKRFFDLVAVLRTDNTVLYDRLQKRNYPQNKVSENVECEIMQVVLDEARGAYDPQIVQELQSNTLDQLEENVEKIGSWAKQWMAARARRGSGV